MVLLFLTTAPQMVEIREHIRYSSITSPLALPFHMQDRELEIRKPEPKRPNPHTVLKNRDSYMPW